MCSGDLAHRCSRSVCIYVGLGLTSIVLSEALITPTTWHADRARGQQEHVLPCGGSCGEGFLGVIRDLISDALSTKPVMHC